jgi:hypothetical protein
MHRIVEQRETAENNRVQMETMQEAIKVAMVDSRTAGKLVMSADSQSA